MPALKNARHEAFAQGLAKGLSASEAYRKAGFKDNRANASRLQQQDDIRRRVVALGEMDRKIEQRAEEKAVERAAEKLSITRERVLEEQAAIAFFDPGDVLSWKGNTVVLKDSSTLSPVVRAAISSIRLTRDGLVLTFHSKSAALDALGKTLGIGSDKGQGSAILPGNGELSEMSDLDIARRLAFLLAKGAAQAQGD